MTSREERAVQRALNETDPLLFLDKRWSAFSGIYYCVCRQMEDGSEPLVCVDWRVGATPLPLSMDIVSRVREQEGDITESIATTIANNAARKELMRQKARKEQEEIVEEWQKSGRATGIPQDSYIVVPTDLPDQS